MRVCVRYGTGRTVADSRLRGGWPFGRWKDIFRKPVLSSGDLLLVSMGGFERCSMLGEKGGRIQCRAVFGLRRQTTNRCVSRAPDARRAKLDSKIVRAQGHSLISLSKFYERNIFTMSKRPAEPSDDETDALKSGQRPLSHTNDDSGEFEDEFEDEFESEDEIFEAGADGRPDEEIEAEEREGVRTLHVCMSGQLLI